MFHQILISPQVKRRKSITYQEGVYDLPLELPNDLRLRILGKLEILEKCLNLA